MKNQMPKTIDDYILLLNDAKEKFGGNLEVYLVNFEDHIYNPEQHYGIRDVMLYNPAMATSLYTVKSNVTSSEEKLRLLFVSS